MALLRLAAWQAILAAGFAAFLLGVAVVDATGPRSCGDADASREAGLLTDAQKDYAAILGEEPTSTCAQKGMKELADKHCELADAAEIAKPPDLATAKKEREAALKIEPSQTLPSESLKDCASATSTSDSTTGDKGAGGG